MEPHSTRRRRSPRDLRHRLALCRRQGQGLHRRVSRGLHLRGRADALHPPRRVRRLRRVRARVPRRGDLLRGRRPRQVVRLLRGQRRVLLGDRLARRRREDGPDRARPRPHQVAASAERANRRWPARVARRHGPEPVGPSRLSRGTRSTPIASARAAHPDGIVDLSVGTPVDPTPASFATRSRPRPTRRATPRRTARSRFARPSRRGSPVAAAWHGLGADAVFPTIGSKEFVALLPALLGIGRRATSWSSRASRIRRTTSGRGWRCVDDRDRRRRRTGRGTPTSRLVWVNSPSNPTGAVFGGGPARGGRSRRPARIGAVVASDECYAELAWTEPWTERRRTVACSRPDVCGGSHEGLLVAYSLSKQSSLAGYRAAFAAGTPRSSPAYSRCASTSDS